MGKPEVQKSLKIHIQESRNIQDFRKSGKLQKIQENHRIQQARRFGNRKYRNLKTRKLHKPSMGRRPLSPPGSQLYVNYFTTCHNHLTASYIYRRAHSFQYASNQYVPVLSQRGIFAWEVGLCLIRNVQIRVELRWVRVDGQEY